jgi:hypothetical protein
MVTTCSIAYKIIKIDIACNSCFRLQFVVLGYSRWKLPSFCVLRVFFPNFITLWFRANDTFDAWFVAQMHQSHIGQCSLGWPERNCIRLNPHMPFILWALWTAMATSFVHPCWWTFHFFGWDEAKRESTSHGV